MNRSQTLMLRSLAAGPRTMWDLVIEQNTQHRRFVEALGLLCQQGLVQSDASGTLRLTSLGWKEAEDAKLVGWRDNTCPTCGGRGIWAAEHMASLQREYERLCVGRPAITTEYDQGVVPADVAMSRVALLDQRGDLAGKAILILGDDDLMSLALTLSNLPRRIVVLEIDRRVTSFIRDVVTRQGWHDRVQVVEFDARDPLPSEFRAQFDTFFTDPVETVGGITLFLSRCAEALRGDGAAGYFGLTSIESGWAKWLDIERAAVEMRLAITEVIRDFNRYLFLGEGVLRGAMKIVSNSPVPLPPPDRLWFSSTIFRLQAVGDPQPKIVDGVQWGSELYADEDTI